MKPDGVSTTPAEPTEALGAAAIDEEVANEEQPQEDQGQSPPQPEESENVQEGADSKTPPSEKEANGKTSAPKNTTKAPVKTKSGAAATKTTAASRPVTAQSRVANGASRPATNGATKKPATAAAAVKKPTSVGAAAQAKKAPTAAQTAAPRTQTKVVERKPVGTARPAVASTSSGTKPVVASNTATVQSKKPAAATNNAAPKPKTTAPRPATAPAAKPAVSAASKVAPVTKTRPTTAPTSHATTSTASIKPTISTTKPAASRTASAPSAARSASLQPSKATTTTTAAKKDAGQISSKAPARKPIAPKTTTTARPIAAKPLKSEPPKPAVAAKRLPVDTKTRPKLEDNKPVPTRKVPPSPRNTPTRPASSKLAAASNNQKQAGSSTPVAVKRQTTKPTQSVSPLVVKGKAPEEPAAERMETSASVAAVSPTTITAAVDANTIVQLEEQLNQGTSVPTEVLGEDVVQVPSLEQSDVETVHAMEEVNVESLAVQLEAEAPIVVSVPPSIPVGNESNDDYISVETPIVQEVPPQEPVSATPFEVSVAATMIPKDMEVFEKAEQVIHNDAEEEEEEREGSQQVSISDMSGTQPTEESRPGSAGLAGSVWRAGALLSELDSEDVSCSQQGASELSAPGVLEGTESMDDLGEASLKGADGEGASAGSPDFEKVPDIPANEDDDNEDDDDYDRVCDMEVGSERAEDPHRQCHDNDYDEDEDVEMASEGITESGLESYGNADEDDFAEDYRLDNLNRMQPPPIVPSAPPAAQWDQANPFADSWVQPLQEPTLPSSPSSSPRQANLETLAQASHQAWLDLENAKGGPVSFTQPLMEPVPSSPKLTPVPSAEKDASFSPDLGSHTQGISQTNTSGLEQAAHSCSDASTPEELQEYNIISGVENLQQQAALVDSVPAALPDIMQDLGIQLEHGDEEEEPETLPADDVLGGPATAPTSVPSSPSSATEDEASDTEGEMQISEPSTEPVAAGNECFGSVQVAHNLSTLEEREEACAETEGGGGGETPQSATSAASYGFDCTTTSNSNAQSTTESCAKSPACAPGDVDKLHVEQQGVVQPNSEQQYMLCVKAGEELPLPCSPSGTEPTEGGLANPSSSEHHEDAWDLDAQHPYYSTICEKTDGSLAGNV
ncbi:uncharacterized protein prr36a isoform X2 [Salminus brasiliensis]|uniref:uncharacterized protein prr36a isoform X2 n=1 Tax=Salminus brasiliensis TaxID=930266 RepID=UPI003B831444